MYSRKHEARLDFLQSKMEEERESSVNDRQLKELQAMLRNSSQNNDKTLNASQTHENVMEPGVTEALPLGDIFRSMLDDLRRTFESTRRSQSEAIENHEAHIGVLIEDLVEIKSMSVGQVSLEEFKSFKEFVLKNYSKITRRIGSLRDNLTVMKRASDTHVSQVQFDDALYSIENLLANHERKIQDHRARLDYIMIKLKKNTSFMRNDTVRKMLNIYENMTNITKYST